MFSFSFREKLNVMQCGFKCAIKAWNYSQSSYREAQSLRDYEKHNSGVGLALVLDRRVVYSEFGNGREKVAPNNDGACDGKQTNFCGLKSPRTRQCVAWVVLNETIFVILSISCPGKVIYLDFFLYSDNKVHKKALRCEWDGDILEKWKKVFYRNLFNAIILKKMTLLLLQKWIYGYWRCVCIFVCRGVKFRWSIMGQWSSDMF